MVDLYCRFHFVLTRSDILPRFQVGAMMASLKRLRDILLGGEIDVLYL